MDRLWTPWRYSYIAGTGAAADAGHPREGRPGVPPALAGWPAAGNGCVFCNMLAAVRWAETDGGFGTADAERAALILARGERTFLVLNRYPYTSGHLMAVPYEHHASLAGLPLPAALDLMHDARRAELALRATYRPDGLNMGLNLGDAAGAGVAEHLHLHVLPRWTGDANFMTVIAETRVMPELLDTTWQRLREALAPSNEASATTGSNQTTASST